MISVIVGMKADLEALKTAFGTALRVGPVEKVDAEKGFRLKLGEGSDGEPFLSPWYPHPESGGKTKTWAPLSKGQVVGVLNPVGDPRQGVLLRAGFSDENPPPSQSLEENVFTAFGLKATVKDGKLVIDGDLIVHGAVDITGARVTHNDKNIGSTHRHHDVEPGPALTGVPDDLAGAD